MKPREYHAGPGAVSLLLIIVVVSMSVLGLLSLISARGDAMLTERAVKLAEAERRMAAESEELLAQLDAVLAQCASGSADDASYMEAVRRMLPDEMNMDGRIVSWELAAGEGRTLKCSVEVLPAGGGERFLRKSHIFEAAVEESYDDMNFEVWE